MKIVLASRSPRRAHLLKQIGLKFIIDPSSFDEKGILLSDPATLARLISEKKGLQVAARHANALIIAADTIVVFNNVIMGKPEDANEARKMLSELSNNTHSVYSGVFVAGTDQNGDINSSFSLTERTKVTFSPLTNREIDHYIAGGSPFDKAGSYGIQDDTGSLFVKKIDGDFYNVVGFPLNAFYQKLKLEMPSVFSQLFLD